MSEKRKHYRLNCLQDLLYQEISTGQEREEDCWHAGIVTDIGGGGCRFHSKLQQRPKSLLALRLDGIEERLVFKAKVLASQPLQNSSEGYENRVEFLELSFSEQEQLIKWIFEEKRKIQLQERSSVHEKKYFDY